VLSGAEAAPRGSASRRYSKSQK